jgi:hypothetical protein
MNATGYLHSYLVGFEKISAKRPAPAKNRIKPSLRQLHGHRSSGRLSWRPLPFTRTPALWIFKRRTVECPHFF